MYQKNVMIISRYFAFDANVEQTFNLEALRKSDLRSLSIHGIAVVVDHDTVIEVTLSKPARRFSPVTLKEPDERLGIVAGNKDHCLYYIGGALFARDEHQMAVALDIYLRYDMEKHTVAGTIIPELPEDPHRKVTSIEVSFMLETTPMGDPSDNKQTPPAPKDIPL